MLNDAQLVNAPDLGPGAITPAITAQTDRLLQLAAERAFPFGQQQPGAE